MLVEKFQYKNLTRKSVDGKRLYSTPDGNAVPSVTTILSATQTKEKQEDICRAPAQSNQGATSHSVGNRMQWQKQ